MKIAGMSSVQEEFVMSDRLIPTQKIKSDPQCKSCMCICCLLLCSLHALVVDLLPNYE